MSLENINQYMRELEAVKFYEKVKREHHELTDKVTKLESSLKSNETLIKSLNSELKEKTRYVEEILNK